jgi:putative endonuclease
MYIKQKIGKLGEDLASKYLIENGYSIMTRNFYCRQGEIDIVATKQDEIIFVEVKTRTNFYYGRPAEAVNGIKRKNMQKASAYFIYKNRLNNISIRFDVIEIFIEKNQYKINHIKQII